MYKEIEEAREVENKCSRQWPFHDTTHPTFCELRKSHQNLLALFDRMQQEPVVEISPNDRVVEVAGKMSPGRYRRELEGCNDAK